MRGGVCVSVVRIGWFRGERMVVRMEMAIVSSCKSAEVKPVEMNRCQPYICTLVSVRIPHSLQTAVHACYLRCLGTHICVLIF